jgi:hypothetical protein
MNVKYIAASRLFDTGHFDGAQLALDQILAEESGYPFAVMLSKILKPNQ